VIVPAQVVQDTTRRFTGRAGERRETERKIAKVRAGTASVLDVDSPDRVELRRRRVRAQPVIAGEGVAEGPQVLERIIEGNNLLAVAFLETGTQVAGTVGRVHIRDQFARRGFGTGFMVSPRVMMTNNHVLRDAASARFSQIEFGFQNGVDGQPRPTHVFDLQPDALFLTDAPLDVTVVAVSATSRATGDIVAVGLAEFGFNRLSGQQGKILLGENINIVQHPAGEPKQLALQQNELVDRFETFLHYRGDTLPGSSGSPLFNNQWEVLGLHHSGVPERDPQGRVLTVDGALWDSSMGEDAVHWVANEGIRISSILTWLEVQAALLGDAGRALVREIAEAGPAPEDTAAAPVVVRAAPNPVPAPAPTPTPAPAPAPESQDAQREVSVTVPVTITVRVGTPDGGGEPHPEPVDLQEAISIDPDYSTRAGYDPGFLGVPVPLPALGVAQRAEAATNTQAAAGRDDTVLDYHHYSVVMHRARRLAWVTAVNIDGASWRDIRRETDRWIFDPRIAREVQLGPDMYASNDFDRGHLVRRIDATWGPDDQVAKVANDDTFHFTNCSPQHKDFNQGSALWAGLEKFVLDQAKADQKRMTVFNGPVLLADDPWYRGAQVPLAFWKLMVVGAPGGALSAAAFLISQRELVEMELHEAAFVPETFQVPVSSISELTTLDFSHLHPWDGLEPLAQEQSLLTESAGLPLPGLRLGTYADLRL
jgi:endonuclease G